MTSKKGGGRFGGVSTALMALLQVALTKSMVSEVHLSVGSAQQSSLRNLRRLIGRVAFGASLLASCLQAGAASALSFDFSFTGIDNFNRPAEVVGTVAGLVDNLNGQTKGLTVTIEMSTYRIFILPIDFTDADYVSGTGFDVANGWVAGVNIFYKSELIKSDSFPFFHNLFLGNQGLYSPEYSDNYGGYNLDPDSNSTNTLRFAPVFTPVAPSAPGPIPLFGAAAAFGWSRQLRRRIKTPA
jgi:hypothetical protein